MKEYPVLSAKNISHTYESKDGQRIKAIEKIDLNVMEGEFVALIGTSGGGKSTLLKIISGLMEPTTGEVEINGGPVDFQKNRIGYISQSDTLLPWRNILDNVSIGLEMQGFNKAERYERSKEFIDKFGLSGFEYKYPKELSGGMSKRALIIRALVMKPSIIIMDEPFGPLDVFTREVLQQEVLKIWKEEKTTFLYVTHDIMEAIYLASRIVVLTHRPARIKAEFDVDFSLEGSIEDIQYHPEVIEIQKEIWNVMREEVARSRQDIGG
ncbi:ABC transporter ATP-binding protein [Aerococcus sp. UMB10185]|uniref:ABC transporter ATP-binding protein n=1 Tax=unclassified Aerococcus TaxID=2618060 RepID=UPI0008A6178B|nr:MULTISPECIES: ABC transporter ATP-binding protein [unclassified Aerococcus]KAB0647348.1 ABC transporter ATP-binding protein [Aerococcus sanguinicola]MDK6233188.1 ABC transporter ATP-binding protein [Aerococcus sp. UMB10185]MDK6856025.1 ABC transporter ATP-binding protein [Aerococcus sp. UMB7533]OFN00296.1 ABC transporter ATP-binding protein [Aerococcus sp. HMSC062A02]OHO45023.1 ABC transporter ATP-binding protein [Aerococcus sp. HMSC035B07]